MGAAHARHSPESRPLRSRLRRDSPGWPQGTDDTGLPRTDSERLDTRRLPERLAVSFTHQVLAEAIDLRSVGSPQGLYGKGARVLGLGTFFMYNEQNAATLTVCPRTGRQGAVADEQSDPQMPFRRGSSG